MRSPVTWVCPAGSDETAPVCAGPPSALVSAGKSAFCSVGSLPSEPLPCAEVSVRPGLLSADAPADDDGGMAEGDDADPDEPPPEHALRARITAGTTASNRRPADMARLS